MSHSESVICPKCDSEVVILPDDQTCTSCELNIADWRKEHREYVQERIEDISEAIERFPFETEDIHRYGNVIKIELQGDGAFTLGEDWDKGEIEEKPDGILERQMNLAELQSEITSITGVADDVECWLASESEFHSNQKSKFDMKPMLEFSDDGKVVLIVDTQFQQ